MRAWVFPGQGSQHRDMGAELFDRFPDLAETAGQIIGVPVRDLCRDVHGEYLGQTRYVQPAVFVVSALAAEAASADGPPPDVVAGHSLGEFAALHVAGSLDFETALRLVVRRGEVMGRVSGGGMAALLGLPLEWVEQTLAGLPDLELANHNLPDQFVVGGTAESVRAVVEAVRRHGTGRCVPLAVSVPAHTGFMASAAEEFGRLLRGVRFTAPRIPVISNVTARPHDLDGLADLLRDHVVRPVRWWDTLCHLARSGVTEVTEVGPGEVLTRMWVRAGDRLPRPAPPPAPVAPPPAAPAPPAPVPVAPRRGATTGSAALQAEYDISRPCLVGALGHGVTSPTLLRRLCGAGLFGFLGTDGLGTAEVAAALGQLRDLPRYGAAWPTSGVDDRAVAQLYLSHDVRAIQVDGARGTVPPQVVRYRFADGDRRVLALTDDMATAVGFLRPADPDLVGALVAVGDLDVTAARRATTVPVATDVAVRRDALDLVPALVRHRDLVAPTVRVGVAGVGSPAAVAAAFALGADFVVVTTLAQCTPEAATSDEAKDLLAGLDVTEVRDAPDPELFALGVRSRVAGRGTLYAARAERLYRLYLRHDRLEDIPAADRAGVERVHFGRSLDEVWAEVAAPVVDDRHRMALVFGAYCRAATAAAVQGDRRRLLDFRIPCGTDMGTFNRLTVDGPLADWRRRHVDLVVEELMARAPGTNRPA
ncbi:acyltransferase domain-containing protein [Micromonospora sp. SH-82]|uniref:acyltransferase domain-containing protein n=1 Tax=Micromonospora sp. SH-82 TaxID=3132938 RepID=UPI003EC0AD92